jgi:hypothetical protein
VVRIHQPAVGRDDPVPVGVGVALATEMHDTGIATLEQFFGLPAAPNYQ